MADQNTDPLLRNEESSLLQSESPDPSIIQAIVLNPEKNYVSQSWKNGLGRTEEISIYPPDKDFIRDEFFWRFSVNQMHADCNFSVFPGYDCTAVVLPGEDKQKPSLTLSHRGRESSTKTQPLFPYTWRGEWTTTCKVVNAPVKSLQFMMKRELGNAQVRVEKIGSFETDLQGDVDSGKNMLFGAFALVYVVEGYISVLLDENHAHEQKYMLKAGETLFVERDEDASPTSILMNATNQQGQSSTSGIEATVIVIQIEEGKTYGGILQKPTSIFTESPTSASTNNDGIVPSQRRPSNRRPSLLVSMNEDHAALATAASDAAAKKHSPYSLQQQQQEKNELDTRLSLLNLDAPKEPIIRNERRDSLASLSFDPNALYEPPPFALMHRDTQMPPPIVSDKLEINEFPLNTISTAWIKIMTQGLGEWLKLPIIVCRGTEDGPVVGITAAVHGNELNGVPCIHRVISQIDVNKLKGTVVAVPCVNVWGFLKFQREFADGRDLNRQFPGKEDGYASQVFCYHLMGKIISQFNYQIDLHTASFGRINSYYVRADLNDPVGASMAKLQRPQVLLHNSGQDGTLRSAAAARGIKAITVEIGNPQTFQDRYVQWSFMGIMRILDHFDMYPLKFVNMNDINSQGLTDENLSGPPNTVLCSRGFWLYTKTGGLLEVYPDVNKLVRKGEIIARIKNMFGNVVDEYFSPCTGVVIGRSSNPVAMSGDRIVHMGVIKKTGEVLAKAAKENY